LKLCDNILAQMFTRRNTFFLKFSAHFPDWQSVNPE